MRTSNTLILSAVTPASNQSSAALWTDNTVLASFQLVASGTAAGSAQVQASNDQAVGLPAWQFQPTNWFNIGSPAAVSGAGVSTIATGEISYEYLRLNYTSTATGVQTIALVADVSGSLNNKFFLFSSANNATNYYAWFNINSAGTDPALAGKTGVPITGATNASASTLGTALATAIAALNSTNDFTTSGTSTVTVTNKASGPFTPMSDTGHTGFTFAVTTPTGTLTARMKAMSL